MKNKKCRHKWLRKFVEGNNCFGDLALFEVWYCKKCKIETKGEFRGVIKESRKSAKLKESINPRGCRKK